MSKKNNGKMNVSFETGVTCCPCGGSRHTCANFLVDPVCKCARVHPIRVCKRALVCANVLWIMLRTEPIACTRMLEIQWKQGKIIGDENLHGL